VAAFFKHIIGFTFILSWVITDPLSFLSAMTDSSLSWVCPLTSIPSLLYLNLFTALLYQMDRLGSYCPRWWAVRWWHFFMSWVVPCWWWLGIHKPFHICIELGHHKSTLYYGYLGIPNPFVLYHLSPWSHAHIERVCWNDGNLHLWLFVIMAKCLHYYITRLSFNSRPSQLYFILFYMVRADLGFYVGT